MFSEQFGSAISCTRRLSFDKWDYYTMSIEPHEDKFISIRIKDSKNSSIRFNSNIPIDSILSGIKYIKGTNPSGLFLRNIASYYIVSDDCILIYNTDNNRKQIGILYVDNGIELCTLNDKSIYNMQDDTYYIDGDALFDIVSSIKDVLDGDK